MGWMTLTDTSGDTEFLGDAGDYERYMQSRGYNYTVQGMHEVRQAIRAVEQRFYKEAL